jgi:protein TonB
MTSLAIEPRQIDATDLEAEKRARRRFRGALFWSGLGHAVVIALLLALWQLPPDEPVPIPPIPVTVVPDQEGQSGAAGGSNGDTAASSSSSESEQASTAAPSQTAPAEAQQQQPQEAEAQPTPPQPTTPQTPTPPAPTDALHLSPSPDAIEPPQPVQPPEPVPPRKPTPPQPKPTPTVAQTPPTPPTPQPATQQAAQAPSAPSTTTSGAVQGADTPLPAGVGGQGRGDAGKGLAEVGNGAANGTGDDYLQKVQRWILRFAKTPDDDCSREHGDGKMEVTYHRDGTVLDVHITQGSGCPASDAEAVRMVKAASPLPPIPDKFPGDPKTLGIPFDFRPGLFDRLFHAH